MRRALCVMTSTLFRRLHRCGRTGAPSASWRKGNPEFRLEQNYPNPFNSETRIPFVLEESLFRGGEDGQGVPARLQLPAAVRRRSRGAAVSPVVRGCPSSSSSTPRPMAATKPRWDGQDRNGQTGRDRCVLCSRCGSTAVAARLRSGCWLPGRFTPLLRPAGFRRGGVHGLSRGRCPSVVTPPWRPAARRNSRAEPSSASLARHVRLLRELCDLPQHGQILARNLQRGRHDQKEMPGRAVVDGAEIHTGRMPAVGHVQSCHDERAAVRESRFPGRCPSNRGSRAGAGFATGWYCARDRPAPRSAISASRTSFRESPSRCRSTRLQREQFAKVHGDGSRGASHSDRD